MDQIQTDAAPTTPYPYSQAIRDGDRVYASGQIGIDPETGELAGDDIQDQAAQTLENLEAVLSEAGTSLDNVVKTTVYLTDADYFEAFNEVYAEYMEEPYPARSAVITDLAAEASVEVDVIAKVE